MRDGQGVSRATAPVASHSLFFQELSDIQQESWVFIELSAVCVIGLCGLKSQGRLSEWGGMAEFFFPLQCPVLFVYPQVQAVWGCTVLFTHPLRPS